MDLFINLKRLLIFQSLVIDGISVELPVQNIVNIQLK